jgi:DNA-binding Lrp family transcriptional regulator
MTPLEFSLLNDFQRGFPLASRPYEVIARKVAVDEKTVIDTLAAMQQRGVVSRVGAVFRPNVVGVSALAALAVSPDRLEEVARCVSAFPTVNHNYQREHVYNLWFVVAAPSLDELQSSLAEIEGRCRSGKVLVLPLVEQFHIDLGFELDGNASPYFRHGAPMHDEVQAVVLTPTQRNLMAALQHGLPLVSRPFAELGCAEVDALDLLGQWVDQGVIRRMGVVVRHHELGYTANAMVVWNVPDDIVGPIGRGIASSKRVSLCYRRPRRMPDWSYNLFCMIHGKDRSDVEERIRALTLSCGLGGFDHQVLFSVRRFKQCGARYVNDALLAAERGTLS